MKKTGIKGLDNYCEQVASGEIEVCEFIKMAVDRHYRDLDRADNDPDFPYYFNADAARHFFDFCATFEHYEGSVKGKSINMEEPQQFWMGSLFGWLHKKTKLRRFNEAYIEMPKKNGKSILAALIGLYGLEYDEEPGAQVYFLANNRMQAQKLCYRAAVELVKNHPLYSKRYKINEGIATMGIKFADNSSFIEPLTSKPKSLDGYNVHIFIGDEIKDWEDKTVWNLMQDGTIARDQPISLGITTAGYSRNSLGYENRTYGISVLKRTVVNERLLCIIYTIDTGEDEGLDETDESLPGGRKLSRDEKEWDTERVWRKANPLYGISVKADYFESKVAKAQFDEQEKLSFMVKHLSVWTTSHTKWMNMATFAACAEPDTTIEKFERQPCFVFYDLSAKEDLCSMGMLFPYGKNEAGKPRYFFDSISFLPEELVENKISGRRSSYQSWVDMGLIRLNEGATIDYDPIVEYTLELTKNYAIMLAGFDPWNAYNMQTDLEKNRLKTITIPQKKEHLSEPMKTTKAWIKEGRIIHNGNPVVMWAMENITAHYDGNENILPQRESRDQKIDPAVTLINLVAMVLQKPLKARKRKRFGIKKI